MNFEINLIRRAPVFDRERSRPVSACRVAALLVTMIFLCPSDVHGQESSPPNQSKKTATELPKQVKIDARIVRSQSAARVMVNSSQDEQDSNKKNIDAYPSIHLETKTETVELVTEGGRIKQVWQYGRPLESEGSGKTTTRYRAIQPGSEPFLFYSNSPQPTAAGQLRKIGPQEQRYWLGINCEEVGPVLKEQLSLSHGLTVVNVVETGPANGRLRRHDVLLKINGERLSSVEQLVEQIQRSAGKASSLRLLRKAKEVEVEVVARKRPEVRFSFEPIVLQTTIQNDINQNQLQTLRAKFAEGIPKGELPPMYILRPGIRLGNLKSHSAIPMDASQRVDNPEIPGVDIEAFVIGISDNKNSTIRIDTQLRNIADLTITKPMNFRNPQLVRPFKKVAEEMYHYRVQLEQLTENIRKDKESVNKVLIELKRNPSSLPAQIEFKDGIARKVRLLDARLVERQADLKKAIQLCELVEQLNRRPGLSNENNQQK